VVSETVAKNGFCFLHHSLPDIGMSVAHLHLLRFPYDVSNLTLDVLLLPVVTYDVFECVRVVDPLNHACVSRKWNDGEGSHSQVSFGSLGIIVEHLVAQTSEVDEALFFA
jgi:hypothetical protein